MSFQGSSSCYCNEFKCLSYFHTSTSDSTVYIGSLTDDFIFEEFSDLEQAVCSIGHCTYSLRNPYVGMYTLYMGKCWFAPCADGCCDKGSSLTCQEKLYDSACYAKESALWYGREEEPLHGGDLSNVLWKILPGVSVMLHKCGVLSV